MREVLHKITFTSRSMECKTPSWSWVRDVSVGNMNGETSPWIGIATTVSNTTQSFSRSLLQNLYIHILLTYWRVCPIVNVQVKFLRDVHYKMNSRREIKNVNKSSFSNNILLFHQSVEWKDSIESKELFSDHSLYQWKFSKQGIHKPILHLAHWNVICFLFLVFLLCGPVDRHKALICSVAS